MQALRPNSIQHGSPPLGSSASLQPRLAEREHLRPQDRNLELEVERNVARSEAAYWKAMHHKARAREDALEQERRELLASVRLRELAQLCELNQQLEIERNMARSEAGYWKAMHHKAREREQALKQKLEETQAKVRLRERQLFGRKSEQSSKGRDGSTRANRGKKPRKRGQQKDAPGHGRRLHRNLPVEEEARDLPDDEKCCPCCGLPFKEVERTEDSEVLEVKVRAYRRRIRRKQYQPTCKCPDTPGLMTAPRAPKLIPKGGYGISVWEWILLDKFLFQRPTSRTLTFFRLAHDMHIPQGTITDGLKRLKPLFEPLYEAIIERNLADKHWHADETRWLVFAQVEGKQGHRWYLWVFLSSDTVVYKLETSRSSQVPLDHFGEEAEGLLNVDRYVAYKVLLKMGRLLLAFCWAHVRRDFLGVAKDWPKLEGWAMAWVADIGDLYHLNKKRLAVKDTPEDFEPAQAKLVKAVEEMATKRDEQLADDSLHPAARKVLESLERHWSGLILFVTFLFVPMDNNEAEQALRNPVVGRKNYYGSGALWSAALSAILFTLFQTLLKWNFQSEAVAESLPRGMCRTLWPGSSQSPPTSYLGT